MKKVCIFLAIASIMCISVLAQDKEEKKPEEAAKTPVVEPSQRVYNEIVLEDFENSNYTDKDAHIRVTKEQKVGIAIRDVFPAPTRNSKKYLGVKVYGKSGDYVTITMQKPLEIKHHAQSISLWVYGKKFSGELSILVQDADNKTHRLILGKLNYLGWRKLTVKLRKNIQQEDKYLAQPRSLKILKILYNPSTMGRLPSWNYFYIDEITAKVRQKYIDKQDDSW